MIKIDQSVKPMLQRMAIVFVIVLFTLGYSYQQRKIYLKLTMIDGPVLKILPKFEIENFFSKTSLKSNELTIGTKGMLVHFWGTWCGPCALEFPELMQFSQKIAKNGIKLLLVDVNDTKIKAKKFLRRFKKYKNDNVVFAFDPTGSLMPLFGTSKVPETFLFSVDGKHLKKFIGPQEWDKPRYLTQILNYLQ